MRYLIQTPNRKNLDSIKMYIQMKRLLSRSTQRVSLHLSEFCLFNLPGTLSQPVFFCFSLLSMPAAYKAARQF